MNHEIHEIHESRLIFADEVYAIQGATEMKLGLLVNFSHYPGAEIKRIAR